MDMGSITSEGAEKYPFCHYCQRGRINSKTQLRNKGFLLCFHQCQRGRMLDMVLELMSKEVNMLNVGHDVMVLALISKRVCDFGIGIDTKRSILWSSSSKLCI
jgi:hypothetical protein